MSKIPVVNEELIEVLKRDLKKSSTIEGTNHLIDFWRDFKRDQPALADLLLTEMRLVKNPKEKGYLAHGAFIIYHALRVQLEIDEMNEAWGE
jgi:hypothetical protein|tara:strand:+ start:236 stop:511 length:276 start_codon:yes stop_codon:yes gene_type:complete